jgi:transcriptional regulator with XRE-family HTH domain
MTRFSSACTAFLAGSAAIRDPDFMSTLAARPAGGTDGDAEGRAVAAARKASGLTQRELSRQAMISLSLLRKVEQGTRPLTPSVRAALAAVLGPILPADLDRSAPARIADALLLLREAMDAYDIPPDPLVAPLSLPQLRQLTESATTWRLASQYARLADLLPGLISGLTAAALSSSGQEQEQAFGLLALAYRAADAIADKHGHHDMSARATDLIRWAAARSADPLLEQMSAYVRAELFFSGQHARSGLRMLDAVTTSMPPADLIAAMAMHGALCMRAAVLAARAGLPGEAADRLAEARAAAQQVSDGVYHGTAFGPSSVRVHELALAVESHDIGRAVKLSGQWQPSRVLPAERRSHFHIEAARAHCWAGHRDQAVTALWQARQAAPQHTRYNPAVSETVTTLIRGSRKPSLHLVQLANWIGLPGPSLTPGGVSKIGYRR